LTNDENAPRVPRLEPLPEDWERALCIVAHPDDLEFGAASAIARWTSQGKNVAYCMVTSGEAGIDALPPPECRGVREAEQVQSARLVGVLDVQFLGLPDGVVEYGVPLRRLLTAQIREHRPDVLITTNFRDTWRPDSLNQADHIAVGRAALDAARDAGNRWIFAEQLVDRLGPWNGVRAVWAAGSPESGHAVDTSETINAGIASLQAHRAYIDGLGWDDFDPREFLEGRSREAGKGLGTRFAAPFEVYRMDART
jgi:LmbE family N-acetylglucosaminyl deacetylase